METETKKVDVKKVIITVLLVLLAAAAVGGGVYYVLNQNFQKEREATEKSEKAMRDQIDALKKETTAKTISSTLSAPSLSTEARTRDLESKSEVQDFCKEGQPNNEIRSYTYLANDNGKYVKCSVGVPNGPGWMIIGKVSNDNWQKIFSGQQVPSSDLANQHKIPSALIGPVDLSGATQVFQGYKNYQF